MQAVFPEDSSPHPRGPLEKTRPPADLAEWTRWNDHMSCKQPFCVSHTRQGYLGTHSSSLGFHRCYPMRLKDCALSAGALIVKSGHKTHSSTQESRKGALPPLAELEMTWPQKRRSGLYCAPPPHPRIFFSICPQTLQVTWSRS